MSNEQVSDNRTQWVTKADFCADYYTCGWRATTRNALGLAAQHAKRHGHRVTCEVIRNVCFDFTGGK